MIGASELKKLEPMVPRSDLKIVAIGGGSGLSILLRGLKQVTRDVVAVVAMSDDGGGSGVLREDLGMLPPIATILRSDRGTIGSSFLNSDALIIDCSAPGGKLPPFCRAL